MAIVTTRVVLEAEASGGSKAGSLPTLLFPLSLPLSIPPKFSDKPVGGKVRSSEGEVPRLPPLQIPAWLPLIIHRRSCNVSINVTSDDFE